MSKSIILILLTLIQTIYCDWPVTFNPNHPLLQGLFYGLAPGLGSQYVPGGKWRPGMIRPFTTKAHTFPLGDKKKNEAAASGPRPTFVPPMMMFHPQPPMMYPRMMYGGGGYGYNPMAYGGHYAASSYAPAYAPSPYGPSLYGPSAYGPSFAPPQSPYGGGHYSQYNSGDDFGAENFGGQFESDPFSSSNVGGGFDSANIEDTIASYEAPVTTIHEEDGTSLSPSPADHATAESMTKKFKSKSGFSFGSFSSGPRSLSFNSQESFLNSKYSPADIYKRLDKLT